jgi:hypothetical protein
MHSSSQKPANCLIHGRRLPHLSRPDHELKASWIVVEKTVLDLEGKGPFDRRCLCHLR